MTAILPRPQSDQHRKADYACMRGYTVPSTFQISACRHTRANAGILPFCLDRNVLRLNSMTHGVSFFMICAHRNMERACEMPIRQIHIDMNHSISLSTPVIFTQFL